MSNCSICGIATNILDCSNGEQECKIICSLKCLDIWEIIEKLRWPELDESVMKTKYPEIQQMIDEIAAWYGFARKLLEYDWDHNLITLKELRHNYSIMLKAKASRGKLML